MPSHLTDLVVRTAKSRASAYKISDAHGLYLLVAKSGAKHWRFDYRFAGARRTLTIGPYPLFSLVEARDARDEARRLLRAGVDPSEQRRQAKLAEERAAGATFAAIADEVLERLEREKRANATLTKLRWLLDFARPDLGRRLVRRLPRQTS